MAWQSSSLSDRIYPQRQRAKRRCGFSRSRTRMNVANAKYAIFPRSFYYSIMETLPVPVQCKFVQDNKLARRTRHVNAFSSDLTDVRAWLKVNPAWYSTFRLCNRITGEGKKKEGRPSATLSNDAATDKCAANEYSSPRETMLVNRRSRQASEYLYRG